MRHLSTWLLLITLGCGYEYNTSIDPDADTEDDDDDDDDDDDSTTTPSDTGPPDTGPTTTTTTTSPDACEPTTPFKASCVWTETAFVISIEGGPGPYMLGLAETGTQTEPWTGEDCVWGYTTTEGTLLSWCHDAGDVGTSLTYSGDPYALASGTTVFTSEYANWVTYYLESTTTGGCWVWGDDIGYYSGLGCNEGP